MDSPPPRKYKVLVALEIQTQGGRVVYKTTWEEKEAPQPN